MLKAISRDILKPELRHFGDYEWPEGDGATLCKHWKLSGEEVIIKLETYGLRVSARLNLEQEGEELKVRKNETFCNTTNRGVCVSLCKWAQ